MMEILSPNENHTNPVFICLYPDNEIDDFKKQFNQLNDSITFCTNMDACTNFIQSSEKQKKTIFLILSHIYTPNILAHIDIFNHVDFLWIYCSKSNEYKYIYHDQLHIVGIYDRIDLLNSSIKQEL